MPTSCYRSKETAQTCSQTQDTAESTSDVSTLSHLLFTPVSDGSHPKTEHLALTWSGKYHVYKRAVTEISNKQTNKNHPIMTCSPRNSLISSQKDFCMWEVWALVPHCTLKSTFRCFPSAPTEKSHTNACSLAHHPPGGTLLFYLFVLERQLPH